MRRPNIRAFTLVFTITIAIGSCFAFAKYEETRLRSLAQSIINDINNPELTTRFIEHHLVLEGSAVDEQERQRALSIAKAYLTGFHIRNLYQKPEILDLVQLKAARFPSSNLSNKEACASK